MSDPEELTNRGLTSSSEALINMADRSEKNASLAAVETDEAQGVPNHGNAPLPPPTTGRRAGLEPLGEHLMSAARSVGQKVGAIASDIEDDIKVVTAQQSTWPQRVLGATSLAIGPMIPRAIKQALVLDDLRAVIEPQSTPAQRLLGAVSLAATFVPVAEGCKIAKVALKAEEIAAERLVANAAERAVATGVENSLASGAERASAAVGENAVESGVARSEQRFGSDINKRPLTEAERRGEFKSAEDQRAFMGPAEKDFDVHHVVERNTEGLFPAEKIHSVHNTVSLERPLHQNVSAIYQGRNPAYGAGPHGYGESLRTYLKDKPWQEHVNMGDEILARHGLDPDELRADTLERFKMRLQEHDRLLEAPLKGPHAPLIGPALAELSRQARETPSVVHVERDGVWREVRAGQQFVGSVQSADGDRITQQIARGEKVAWSREELASQFNDAKNFDAMMQPGNVINVGVGRDGVIDIQHKVLGRGWESLRQQPLQQWQQVDTPSLDQGIGR